MKKTAEFIEEAKEARRAATPKRKRKQLNVAINESGTKKLGGCTGKGWLPGQSGNPSGRPKNDLAREIAQAVFEESPELVKAAFEKALRKGNAYVFKELADRAYGKVKETIEHQGTLGIIEVKARVAELLQKRDVRS